ncbi:uncharacterized protein LOC128944188 isoform X1 [Melozone crissalis]|uniref:uncharacterized protein LOC128944188 isoform X1 n=1 Tax=Melozone crissalis TaxID=40204 RepID=UPI0023D9EE23|nr:uncharacterized protein LOC128944188 isoform X1 [Melozone crissalis]
MSLTSRGTGSHQRMHKRSLSNCLCLPKNSKAKLKRFPDGSAGEDLNSTGTLGCRGKCLENYCSASVLLHPLFHVSLGVAHQAPSAFLLLSVGESGSMMVVGLQALGGTRFHPSI